MGLPQLPLDVWFRISSKLDPRSLSSLSEVNRTLHKVATHESHFRRHLARIHTGPIHPAQDYRRLQALYHPPIHYTSYKLPPFTKMLGLVQDSLLLLDASNSALIVFPSGITVSLKPHLGNLAIRNTLSNLFKSFVVLPWNRAAFINFHTPTTLAVLDVSTGDVKTHTLPGNGALPDSDILRKNLIAAGNNAEWLMYRSSRDKLILFNWRTGNVDREIMVSSNSVKYVMGECPATDSMTIVGTLSEQTTQSRKNVFVYGFDGVDTSFREDLDRQVLMVLRSHDQKTYILLTAPNDDRINKYEETSFYACKKHDTGVKEWCGTLRLRRSPELKGNGRFIQSRQDPCRLEYDTHYVQFREARETLWMELKDDCTVEETNVYSVIVTSCIRRTHNGGLVLAEGYNFHSVELTNPGLVAPPNEARHVCIVADHFLLGLCGHRDLLVYHFDRFCRRGEACACPEFDEPEFLGRTADWGIGKGKSGLARSTSESSDGNENETDNESEDDFIVEE